MAFQAVRESFVYSSAMGFIMAFLTSWNLTVGGMTACALQISVFGVIFLQVVIHLGMAGSTDSI